MTAFQPCASTQIHPICRCHWPSHTFLFPLFEKKGCREKYVSWLLVITLRIKNEYKKYMKEDELTRYKTTFVNFLHQAAVVYNHLTLWNYLHTSWNLLYSIRKISSPWDTLGWMCVVKDMTPMLVYLWIVQWVVGYEWCQMLNMDSILVSDQVNQEVEKLTCTPDLWSWQLEVAAHIMSWSVWGPSVCFLSPLPPFAWITIVQIS